jgi:hypothetical protein
MTPNASKLREIVREFAAGNDGLRVLLARTDHSAWPVGHTSCRNISGTNTPSRHAWGDALDIMRLTKWKDPNDPARGVAVAGEPHYLDEIVSFLRANERAFDLDNTLWRQRNHWDHCHVDFNHHRASGSRPPCMGGSIRTVNPSGNRFVLTVLTDPGSPIGEEVKTLDLQLTLNAAGYGPLAEDGEYGPKTEAAWREMMIDARGGSDGGGGVKYGESVVIEKP